MLQRETLLALGLGCLDEWYSGPEGRQCHLRGQPSAHPKPCWSLRPHLGKGEVYCKLFNTVWCVSEGPFLTS